MGGQCVVMLPIVDECTHECLALEVASSMTPAHVLATLDRLFKEHTAPDYIRSDTASDTIMAAVEAWLPTAEYETFCLRRSDPWAQPYARSFKHRLHDGLLKLDLFSNVEQARVFAEGYRQEYNQLRRQRDLGYVSPQSFSAGLCPEASSTPTRRVSTVILGALQAVLSTAAATSTEQWRQLAVGSVLAACVLALGAIYVPMLSTAALDRTSAAPTPIRHMPWTSDFPQVAEVSPSAVQHRPALIESSSQGD